MATKIFDNAALVGGTTMQSVEIPNCGDLVLDIDLSTNKKEEIYFALKGHEGDNVFKPILDSNLEGIKFRLFETVDGIRLNIKGVDTENFRLDVTVPAGITGTLKVEATWTTNPNTATL